MALTDAKIRAAKPDEKPYKLADSGNMFLLVHPNGSRYWRIAGELESLSDFDQPVIRPVHALLGANIFIKREKLPICQRVKENPNRQILQFRSNTSHG